MNQKLNIYEGNKLIASLNGYAFIDNWGHCIIIVYGEGRRDALSKYLSEKINHVQTEIKNNGGIS